MQSSWELHHHVTRPSKIHLCSVPFITQYFAQASLSRCYSRSRIALALFAHLRARTHSDWMQKPETWIMRAPFGKTPGAKPIRAPSLKRKQWEAKARQGRRREGNLQNPHPLGLLVLGSVTVQPAPASRVKNLYPISCAPPLAPKIEDETMAPKTYETTQRPPEKMKSPSALPPSPNSPHPSSFSITGIAMTITTAAAP